jgi:hypothetical protein
MSKGLKTVLSIAAAVAIPFAAPALASSIGLSSAIGTALGSTTAGSVLGGAATGAALGAAKGAVLGEDVKRSALMGGIGGGVGGYTARPVAGTTAAPGTAQAAVAPGAAPGATQAAGLQMTPFEQQIQQGVMGTSAPSAMTYTPPPMGGLAAPTAAGAGAGAPTTFVEALKQVPSSVAGKFRDPAALADLTLRAGGMLAGSLVAGEGLSAEEQQALNEQAAELRQLQSTNQELFRERLQQAQAMVGESRYFDPEYFGLQSARRAQVTGARAKSAGLRGLSGAARTAEGRRFDLATGRDTGTAYDVGFSTGVQGRVGARQAGLSMFPTERAVTSPVATARLAGEETRNRRRRETQQDVGSLFGSFTGRSK